MTSNDAKVVRVVMRVLMSSLLVLVLAKIGAAGQPDLPHIRIPDCLGVNIHFTSGERKQIEKIAQAGFRWIRKDLTWSHVEKAKGVYDFAAYDELVRDLEEFGLRVVFILDYGNPNYDSGLAPHTEECIEAYAAFAKAAAERYRGKGILWEIWNEPNLDKFWHPKSCCEDYVRLAKAATKAIRQADPEATVIGPALSGWDLGYLERAFKLGLLEHIDGISVHPYGSAKPEDAQLFYSEIRRLIKDYTSSGRQQIPVISSEWGYSSHEGGLSVESQASYLVRMFLANMLNRIPLSIWYDWRNDGQDPREPEHNFGTLYYDFTEKPAYKAMNTLSTALAGFSPVARLYTASDEDYLVLLTAGERQALAAWTVGKPHKVSTPLDLSSVTIIDLYGASRTAEVVKGELVLELTGSPIYVIPDGKSRRWAAEASWDLSNELTIEKGIFKLLTTSTMSDAMTSLEVSGQGLARCLVKVALPKDATESKLMTNSVLVSDGGKRFKVKVTAMVEGIEQPLERSVYVDAALLPKVRLYPTLRRELLFRVEKGDINKGKALSARLLINNYSGIKPAKEQVPVQIGKHESAALVRLPLLQDPAMPFSFACKLQNTEGQDLLRLPTRQYALVETFSCHKHGAPPSNYKVMLDGDPNVRGEAKLECAKPPSGGPESSCVKLDYDLGSGWKFVMLKPEPSSPIPGRPTSALIWIKADDNGAVARLRFIGDDGQTHQPEYGKLDFAEWRVLEAKMTGEDAGHWGGTNNGKVHYPIRWDSVFLLDSVGKELKGTVYLGPLMLVYE